MPVALLPCVVDTSVLIDLDRGRILYALFKLPLYLLTTEALLDELVEPDGKQLQRYGMVVHQLTPSQQVDLLELREQHPGLSLPDVSALILAKVANARLLTSERRLRSLAEQEHVSVSGTLWLLDEMVRLDVLSPFVGAQALKRMQQEGSRLPGKECEKRIALWERRHQV